MASGIRCQVSGLGCSLPKCDKPDIKSKSGILLSHLGRVRVGLGIFPHFCMVSLWCLYGFSMVSVCSLRDRHRIDRALGRRASRSSQVTDALPNGRCAAFTDLRIPITVSTPTLSSFVFHPCPVSQSRRDAMIVANRHRIWITSFQLWYAENRI